MTTCIHCDQPASVPSYTTPPLCERHLIAAQVAPSMPQTIYGLLDLDTRSW